MNAKNTIELNGQRYDATTGTPIGSPSTPRTPTIDGFFKPSNAPVVPQAAAHAVHVRVTSNTPPATQAKQRIVVHTQAHKPQAARTLMRSAVKRPAANLKQQTTVHGTLQHKVPSLIVAKQSAYQVDPNRLERASQASRSPQVSRYAGPVQALPITVAPLQVQPVPEKPEAKEPVAAPGPVSKPIDIFEHAIANASHYVDVKAHQAKYKRHRRNHALSLATGGLALIVIAGFVAYHNSPGMQLKVASFKSGVATTMPNFKAAGFTYQGSQPSDGKLTMNFSDQDGSFELVQQTTNLSGSDMIDNIGSVDASGTPTYDTLQADGTTVYRFSNNQATWVSGGKWYTLSGTQDLTNSQVTSLVKNI